MTVTLDLNPDVEAGLTALARAQGLTLEAYVERMLRDRSAAAGLRPKAGDAEKAVAFVAWARGHRPVGSLTDDSLRRENLVREPR
jgi:hypothetical protein